MLTSASRDGSACQAPPLCMSVKGSSPGDGLERVARLYGEGELRAARDSCRAWLADPLMMRVAELWWWLGRCELELGNAEEALKAAVSGLDQAPGNTNLMRIRGRACRVLGRTAEALEIYRWLSKACPQDADVWYNLGNIERELGNGLEALAAYDCSESLLPGRADVLSARGLALAGLGLLGRAEAMYREALARDPGFLAARYNLATLQLMTGRWEEGWLAYETRWEVPGLVPSLPTMDCPRWRGESVAGKTILVVAEQGLGDAIQFARFVEPLAVRGGRVVIRCHSVLTRLLATAAGVSAVVSNSDPMPKADCYAPMLSLPGLLGIRVEDLPGRIPYLKADSNSQSRFVGSEGLRGSDGCSNREPDSRVGANITSPVPASASQRSALPGQGQRRLRVGVVWSGNVEPDSSRSIPLKLLEPLLVNESVDYFSLQKGSAAQELLSLSDRTRVADLASELKDFAATAEVMATLDLVITVDTSVAHLAGAMGKPVWVLLKQAADWRWMTERERCLWYPSMRLFRQERAGDWARVVSSVQRALEEVLGENRPNLGIGDRRTKDRGPGTEDRELRVKGLRAEAAGARLLDMGVRAHRAGDVAGACRCYEDAIAADRQLWGAWMNLAIARACQGRLTEALVAASEVLKESSGSVSAHLLMGSIHHRLGDYGRAIENCRAAVALDPGNPDARYNLGLALQSAGRPGEAEPSYSAAIELRSNYRDAWVNLGTARLQQNRLREAEETFRKALESWPMDAEAHYQLGVTLLLAGDFERGWRDYEWRWQLAGFPRLNWEHGLPAWAGEELAGRRIVVIAEQGAGDTIQFLRFVPELARRGAEVVVACDPSLARLVASVEGVRAVITRADQIPAEACYVNLLSLPRLLGAIDELALGHVPYIRPRAGGPRLGRRKKPFRVGVVWAGNPCHRNDRNRSMALSEWLPLFEVERERGLIEWLSFQCGAAAKALGDGAVVPGVTVMDVAPLLKDYADTVSVMADMDLLISVDTSVAHLAGAMGKPVWVLLPHHPDWRWMLGRADSPWYSTMRLYRQQSSGNWAEVIQQVAEALKQTLRSGANASSSEACQAGVVEKHLTEPALLLCRSFDVPRPTSPSHAGDLTQGGSAAPSRGAKPSRADVAPNLDGSASPGRERRVLYFAGQPGKGFGWGICNRHLMDELAKQVSLVPMSMDGQEWHNSRLPGALFTPISDESMAPQSPARGWLNAGYTFFERELPLVASTNARQYDVIFAGSTWCVERLREKGVNHTKLLIQGVDHRVFHPGARRKGDGRFLVFSGGKFELRKGQDLVLRAFQIFQQRHRDAWLVAAWHNPWPQSMDTMHLSPHLRYRRTSEDVRETIAGVMADNGMDARQVILLPSTSAAELAEVYRACDVGLFPNRCEGGTNLVLMEFMACGRPAIVSYSSGHKDVVRAENAFLLRSLRPLVGRRPGDESPAFRWDEPSLDEMVAALEAAYAGREKMEAIGRVAAEDLRRFTWERTASTLLQGIGWAETSA